MYKTSSLLLVSILAVALMAPPAHSQTRKITLEDVTVDVLNLQGTVKEMQLKADAKNAETKMLLEQILARFGTIDASVQKLGTSLAEIKADDDKSAKELQEARKAVNTIKDNLDKLDLAQTLLDIKNGIGGLKTQIKDMQNTETPLPTSRQAFDSAWGLLSQGFYDDAISEFRDFVKTYPKDPKAARAQLFIGNAYFDQKKLEQARDQYDLTIQNYPESEVKCTALYKKGKTLVEPKQAAEAKQVLQSVLKECPNTDEFNLATADLAVKPATPARGARGK